MIPKRQASLTNEPDWNNDFRGSWNRQPATSVLPPGTNVLLYHKLRNVKKRLYLLLVSQHLSLEPPPSFFFFLLLMSSVKSTMRSSNTQTVCFSSCRQIDTIPVWLSGAVEWCISCYLLLLLLLLTGIKGHTPTARWQQTQWLEQPVLIYWLWLSHRTSQHWLWHLFWQKKTTKHFNTLSHEITNWKHLKVPNEKTEHYYNSQKNICSPSEQSRMKISS